MAISPHCPTCHKRVTWEGNPHRPFCSERCRTVDLGAWADERHRIPGEPIPEDDGEKTTNEPKNKC